jgi:hypothetical protein
MTEGQSLMGSAFLFPAPPDSPQAINSGGSGAERPREVIRRRLIPQAAVGPLLVVVAVPSLDFLFSILQAQKPVLVQTFLPKPAVKRLDEGVVRGLPRPGEVQDYAMGVGPQVNFLGDKLRAIVHPDAFRHPILGHRQVEGCGHIIAPVA